VKLLVLAAGYATRLYPLTLDRPKALLTVAGRPMIEHVVDRLGPIKDLDGVYLVTNAKFAEQFRAWADGYEPARPGLAVTVIDDGTTSDETRLGAIGDIELVIRTRALDDDLIVVASDNLFTEDLTDFGAFSRAKNAAVVAVYDVGDLSEMSKYNSISVNEDGRVTFFEEKPERPASTLTGIALYFYPRPVLPLIGRYVAEGNNPDQPGRLVEWLYTRTPVYAWPVPGRWYDIGSEESLREADRVLGATA
jgi:glucose-1-phosphate thymidylyltransferase